MASAFEGLRSKYDRLSERERRLVLITAAVATVMIVGGVLVTSQGALDDKRKQVRQQQEQLDKILSFESAYKEAEAEEKRAIARLRSNKVSLFSQLNQAATGLGLSLRDLNERELPVKDAEVKEIQVEVNLKDVSIDKLNQFLKEVEGEAPDGLVKVVKLKVKTRHDNEEMLDVTLTVSTWKQS